MMPAVQESPLFSGLFCLGCRGWFRATWRGACPCAGPGGVPAFGRVRPVPHGDVSVPTRDRRQRGAARRPFGNPRAPDRSPPLRGGALRCSPVSGRLRTRAGYAGTQTFSPLFPLPCCAPRLTPRGKAGVPAESTSLVDNSNQMTALLERPLSRLRERDRVRVF